VSERFTGHVDIARITTKQIPDLARLRELATAEGYSFVERAEVEWLSGANRFDSHGEGFFVAHTGDTSVGMCGLNSDPYLDHRTVVRLRHLYVAPEARRRGVGRRLVASCLDLARGRFDRVRLRTFEADGSRLYETMGFRRVEETDATHSLDLAEWRSNG
jgi:GNAT superfamily N-acetyltransferase